MLELVSLLCEGHHTLAHSVSILVTFTVVPGTLNSKKPGIVRGNVQKNKVLKSGMNMYHLKMRM